MKQELSGWDLFRARLATWIIVEIASRISPLAVLALCLDVAEKYQASIPMEETE